MKHRTLAKSLLAAVVASAFAAMTPALAWEPTKTVEFIVPAGTGGGALSTPAGAGPQAASASESASAAGAKARRVLS